MKNLIIASLLTLTVAGIAPAQAAPSAPAQLGIAGTSELLTTAASNNKNQYRNNNNRHKMRQSWDRNRDGSRCRSRSNNCRHYHNGYWYANPWWALPLIGGSIILNSQNNRSESRHVSWCEDQYRSYNRRTNTWIANSGDVRQCVSPYGS